MGVFDKLKNMFFEEEEEEIEEPIRKPKSQVIAKKIDLPEMPKVNEEKSQRELEIEEEVVEKVEKKGISERDLRRNDSFNFPMSFDDDDFKEESYEEEKPERIEEIKEEVKNVPYGEKNAVKYNFDYKKTDQAYKGAVPFDGTIDIKKEQKVFRPTPIISPIYGVLDKNYKKDDIVTKKEIKTPSSYSKKVDLDSVREKAYGDLASDISNMLDEKVEPNNNDEIVIEKEETTLYDLNDDSSVVVSKVTMGDAIEYYNDLGLEYNVDYKDHAKEKATGRRTKKEEPVENNNNEEVESYDDNGDLELENNLFDLIDSMYNEKEE